VLRAFLDGAVYGTVNGDDAPRVLLLHGWRRTKEDFTEVAAQLLECSTSSLAIDLPGFGATPPPAAPVGARGYATTLEPLLDELASSGGAPPVVVGHSFGGRVAVCLAAQSPELVGGLVLTGVPLIAAAMPKGRASRRYRALRFGARLGVVSDARLEAARKRFGSDDYRAASGVIRDVLVALVNESYEPELAALRCPTVLVWGSDDRTVPVAVAHAAAGVAPSASLEVLQGVGHLVPTEAPTALSIATHALVRSTR
jgi:pimeloyl-ACP methyl ester carboxylesterase